MTAGMKMSGAKFCLKRLLAFFVAPSCVGLAFTVLAFIVAALLSPPPAWAGEIAGRASVIDGDTIEIAGTRIRLNGIDAPESAQICRDAGGRRYRCGALSAAFLDDFLSRSRPARCRQVDTDRYGRVVALCRRADGADVQSAMVTAGWALDWPRYSKKAYAGLQEEARRNGAGVWRGDFDLPWEWRASRKGGASPSSSPVPSRVPARAPAAPAQTVGSGRASGEVCLIKGNINARGKRLYHLPGDRYYDRTVIDTGKGERWFCSEEEAREAGWRHALR